jgi:hypothetical protein
MKGRLVALIGVFCIAMLIASGAYADKPPDKPDKPGKPPRPGNIAEECIAFAWDLESVPGGTLVVGCCPNAGPSPAYTMNVHLDVAGIHDDARVGYLFAKPVRTKFKGQTTRRYLVQFNTWDWNAEIPPGEGDYFFDIRCDGNDIDETNDVLTVTVVDETATLWVLHNVNPECDPSIYPYCDDPCDGREPNCDPSDNPTCYHPCNEEMHPNVSFVMTKTADLSNCPVVPVVE